MYRDPQPSQSERPLVSVVMTAYNRAGLIVRAINSLYSQGIDNWHLIVVDDASSDNTAQVVALYDDPRIEYVRHELNQGVTAAKNTGLDRVRGEWFFILDSDDELVPFWFHRFLVQHAAIDPEITAMMYNCIDTTTKRFSGYGLDHNQYVPIEQFMVSVTGQHKTVYRTDLLGDLRFNGKMRGGEITLWAQLVAKSKQYYINEPCMYYHTEGADRLSIPKVRRMALLFRYKSDEVAYMNLLKRYNPNRHRTELFYCVVSKVICADREGAVALLADPDSPLTALQKIYCRIGLIVGPTVYRSFNQFWLGFKTVLRSWQSKLVKQA